MHQQEGQILLESDLLPKDLKIEKQESWDKSAINVSTCPSLHELKKCYKRPDF
jgi:hypothetical protein